MKRTCEAADRTDPARGDPQRCEVHGCFCVIKSVTEDVWDPDWFCPLCTPQYLKPEASALGRAGDGHGCESCANGICKGHNPDWMEDGCPFWVAPAVGERR